MLSLQRQMWRSVSILQHPHRVHQTEEGVVSEGSCSLFPVTCTVHGYVAVGIGLHSLNTGEEL